MGTTGAPAAALGPLAMAGGLGNETPARAGREASPTSLHRETGDLHGRCGPDGAIFGRLQARRRSRSGRGGPGQDRQAGRARRHSRPGASGGAHPRRGERIAGPVRPRPTARHHPHLHRPGIRRRGHRRPAAPRRLRHLQPPLPRAFHRRDRRLARTGGRDHRRRARGFGGGGQQPAPVCGDFHLQRRPGRSAAGRRRRGPGPQAPAPEQPGGLVHRRRHPGRGRAVRDLQSRRPARPAPSHRVREQLLQPIDARGGGGGGRHRRPGGGVRMARGRGRHLEPRQFCPGRREPDGGDADLGRAGFPRGPNLSPEGPLQRRRYAPGGGDRLVRPA